MDDAFDLLTTTLLPGVNPRTVRELRSRGPLRDALREPEACGQCFPEEARRRLRTGEARRRAEAESRLAVQLGVRIVGRDDADYPPLLAQIYDPPPVLYVRGQLVAGGAACPVALVGSRAASPEGKALGRRMAADLAGAGVLVVSGLARGIDAAAHEGVLDVSGRTVAVLGSGLDRIYPAEHDAMARAIEKDGAVVSEFPFGTGPYASNFPRRNRVIAGWSLAVVVVEAAARSGALVTARCALDAGRDVFAVPGHPSRSGWEGTNQLLRDGAALVRSARDVADEMGLVLVSPDHTGDGEDDVLRCLPPGTPLSADDLHGRLGWPMTDLLTRLSELEIDAKVRRLPGALFVRC